MDLLYLDNKLLSQKNQMNLQTVMQQMIKKSKMRKMEKMMLFKMKVLLEKDIIYTFKQIKSQMN